MEDPVAVFFVCEQVCVDGGEGEHLEHRLARKEVRDERIGGVAGAAEGGPPLRWFLPSAP